MIASMATTDVIFLVRQRRVREGWFPRMVRRASPGLLPRSAAFSVSSSGRVFSSLELRWMDMPAVDRRRESAPEFYRSLWTGEQRLRYYQNLLFNLKHHPRMPCNYEAGSRNSKEAA